MVEEYLEGSAADLLCVLHSDRSRTQQCRGNRPGNKQTDRPPQAPRPLSARANIYTNQRRLESRHSHTTQYHAAHAHTKHSQHAPGPPAGADSTLAVCTGALARATAISEAARHRSLLCVWMRMTSTGTQVTTDPLLMRMQLLCGIRQTLLQCPPHVRGWSEPREASRVMALALQLHHGFVLWGGAHADDDERCKGMFCLFTSPGEQDKLLLRASAAVQLWNSQPAYVEMWPMLDHPARARPGRDEVAEQSYTGLHAGWLAVYVRFMLSETDKGPYVHTHISSYSQKTTDRDENVGLRAEHAAAIDHRGLYVELLQRAHDPGGCTGV
eukprot:jgi/Ulvmu1/4175/UM019_0154.1